MSSPIQHLYGSWTQPMSFPIWHLYRSSIHPISSPIQHPTVAGPTPCPREPYRCFKMLTPPSSFQATSPLLSLGATVLYRQYLDSKYTKQLRWRRFIGEYSIFQNTILLVRKYHYRETPPPPTHTIPRLIYTHTQWNIYTHVLKDDILMSNFDWQMIFYYQHYVTNLKNGLTLFR